MNSKKSTFHAFIIIAYRRLNTLFSERKTSFKKRCDRAQVHYTRMGYLCGCSKKMKQLKQQERKVTGVNFYEFKNVQYINYITP